MPRGGARSRSGPAPDPNSRRSDRRGLSERLRALPAEGYTGDPPPWPLPPKGTKKRERDIWKRIWTYPQAVAWASEPWRWLTIAQYVRQTVKAEDPEAPASAMTAVLRLADTIGLSPAGLRENGWTIAASEMEEAAEPTPATTSETPPRRLRAVNDG